MSNTEAHMQIARKLRSVETVKIELVQQVAEVFRGVQTGSHRELSEALGGLIGIAYFLGEQMGISFDAIDCAVQSVLPGTMDTDGALSHDFESVQQYLASRRR